MQQNRSMGLDLLRALAILFVVICHGIFIFYDVVYEPLGNLLIHYGHYGVSLFFVLSGFLIGRIFIEDYTSKHTYTYKDICNFWKRRWFRTLPNYFFFLLIYIGISLLVSSKIVGTAVWTPNFTLERYSLLPRFLFFGQNLFTENPSFFGQSWSLSVEEWFYLLLPLMFTSLFRSNKGSKRGMLLKLGGLLLFLVIFKFLVFFFALTFYNEIKVIFCLDFILFGVLVAACYHHYQTQVEQLKKLLLTIGIGLFVFTNLLYMMTSITERNPQFYQLVINCLTSLSFALILPYFIQFNFKRNLFAVIVEKISLASYSMYLSHFIFLEFLMHGFILKFFPDSHDYSRIFAFLLFLTLCTGFSYAHFMAFEKPLMKLRDKEKLRQALAYSLVKVKSMASHNRRRLK